jgi:hypothetical protein
VTGEKPSQAGWHGSSETGAQVPARQNSPVPLAVFAHRQMRMRDLAARSDEKLFRAESSSSGWFRAWANRSYPEGKQLLLRISTVRAALAVPQQKRGQPNERRRKADKRSARNGKDTKAGQAA